MDFNDYVKNAKFKAESTQQSTNNTQTQNIDDKFIQQMLNKYKGMSQEQLLNQLLTETNKQKQSGQLSNKKIDDLSNQLKPFLDANQQDKLDEILKMMR